MSVHVLLFRSSLLLFIVLGFARCLPWRLSPLFRTRVLRLLASTSLNSELDFSVGFLSSLDWGRIVRFSSHWPVFTALLPHVLIIRHWGGRVSPVVRSSMHTEPRPTGKLGRMVCENVIFFFVLLNSSIPTSSVPFVINGFVRHGVQGLHARIDNDSYLRSSHVAHRYRGRGDRIQLRLEYWSV